jgi:hypothetical protein
MKQSTISLVFSAIILVWWAVGLFFPVARVNTAVLILIAVINLPWVASKIKSIEIPGGVKVNFRHEEADKREDDKQA